MTLWTDAQISPQIAPWLTSTFGIEAYAVRDLGLRDADDVVIFEAARTASVVVMRKDSDFVDLVTRRGAPPQVLWLTCGNTSNARLREILTAEFPTARMLLEAGAALVEITDATPRTTP